MCRHGSVLVVVLGLLAILSVIGVAFITMSGLDRSTSASFAMQTQLTLAADGAVDYVCHYLVHDVWTDDGALLTGEEGCERYDYPGDDDLWLARLEGGEVRYSFQGDQVDMFGGINFGGTKDDVNVVGVDNDGDGTDDGIWIPELAAPFDQYVVRASVTVLDHGGLLNVNAHGTTGGWPYAAQTGLGFFISDVALPDVAAARWAGRYLDEMSGQWRYDDDGPCNPAMGETIIENPRTRLRLDDGTTTIYIQNVDLPFTLAEEFELRRPGGTDFQSRLESLGINTDAEQLQHTTVSWTAEVCGDGNALDLEPVITAEDGGWSAPKADLNLGEPQAIYNALLNSGAFADQDASKQFVANIIAFRDADSHYENDFDEFAGAESQPIFQKVVATERKKPDAAGNVTWDVTISLYNPWSGLGGGDLELQPGAKVTLVLNDGTEEMSGLPITERMAKGETVTLTGSVTCEKTGDGDAAEVQDLGDRLTEIRFHADVDGIGDVVMDEISEDEISSLASASGVPLVRNISTATDWRDLTVVTVGDWGAEANAPSGTVAVRFANSVQDEYDAVIEGGPLPPLKTEENNSFKAFARVGDLNQVLCPRSEGSWESKPWVIQVTEATNEADIRFNWAESSYALAADVLCVQSPWLDGFDNDGDGAIDLDDEGTFEAGRFGGPEFRVAGKINLNTATSTTLSALRSRLDVSGLPAINRPVVSIGQILDQVTANGPDALGNLEKRDLGFTRLSNIVTVRSDVFSIYGTVQIVDPHDVSSGEPRIVRSRRFWALVDRSPSLAYPPGDENFIHPRIMNFQWLE